MNDKNRLTFTGRIRSFGHAFNGMRILLLSQHNAWIHAVATVVVVFAGFYFHLARTEWLWILVAIVSVWTAEAFNTAIEYLTDLASPDFHPLAGKAKDVAAGAVLITAIGAAVMGLMIFGPHVCPYFAR